MSIVITGREFSVVAGCERQTCRRCFRIHQAKVYDLSAAGRPDRRAGHTWCTNKSSPPPSGVIKPNPLDALNLDRHSGMHRYGVIAPYFNNVTAAHQTDHYLLAQCNHEYGPFNSASASVLLLFLLCHITASSGKFQRQAGEPAGRRR